LNNAMSDKGMHVMGAGTQGKFDEIVEEKV
jgi:hypothetical protein